MLTDFQNFFSITLCSKFAVKESRNILSREVNRETGNPVYRFQTGNRFAKHTTGCRIFVIDFDGLLRIRNCACCIKIAHLFKVSLQIKLTLIENIQPRK